MDQPTSITVETDVTDDGVVTITGLPFLAGDHLVVQLKAEPLNQTRRFPLRGRPYQFTDPFGPPAAPEVWEACE